MKIVYLVDAKVVEDPVHVTRNSSVQTREGLAKAATDTTRDDSVLVHSIFAFAVLSRIHDRTSAVALTSVGFVSTASALKKIS